MDRHLLHGTMVASYTYDGFGNQIAFSGTIANAYGFTGEQQFGEADELVFLRARYYDSKIGRFISRDPILTPIQIEDYVGWLLPDLNLIYRPQSLHPYVYVQNNPINHFDPQGLSMSDDPCGGEKGTKAYYKCLGKCMIQPFIIKGGFIGGHWALIKVGCKTATKWVSGVGWVIFIGENRSLYLHMR